MLTNSTTVPYIGEMSVSISPLAPITLTPEYTASDVKVGGERQRFRLISPELDVFKHRRFNDTAVGLLHLLCLSMCGGIDRYYLTVFS